MARIQAEVPRSAHTTSAWTKFLAVGNAALRCVFVKNLNSGYNLMYVALSSHPLPTPLHPLLGSN